MKKLLLGVAATALLTTGAIAADPVMAPETVYNSTTFDWDGFYLGLGISGTSWVPASPSYGYVDLIAGFNVTSGNMLFGGEGWISGYSDGAADSGYSGGIEGRIGYLMTPESLFYLSAGGMAFSGGAQYGQLGAGVEFAVTDNVSIDLQYKYDVWSSTIFNGHTVGISANWHF
ncbi:MAG: hypothetical protein L3J13_09085 [Devosiaceae bacterium]|nr:hypothetical protein [Devosiaceae bacterium]